ncbi:MAG TPA: cellulase family glycosylhydrolase [Candidatus Bathyarchaeia archaeon]|nr:cellulase family glycosylhydrolase [Candidatus Bathyarchaeia archaeon]
MLQRLLPVLYVLLVSVSVFAESDSPAWKRVQHLRHGINTGEWFAQSRDYSPQRLRSVTTLDDIARIKSMGFDHVRLSIDPAIFQCSGPWGQCETVQVLDGVIAKALSLDLAVILDIHPSDDYKGQLATSDAAVQKFAQLWERIASYYGQQNPELMFFEVLNEPEVGVYRWAGIQQSVVEVIRRSAPQHTIIVTCGEYSNPDDLARMPEVADNDYIVNFHFYSPHIFTHQGASWGDAFWITLHQVPFPGTSDAVAAAVAKQSDDWARWKLTEYSLDHWDAAHIAGELRFMAEWGTSHHVPLTVNEFGVYRNFSNPDDRMRWLTAVRTALEQEGIGWTMWDYQGGFGVVYKKDGATTEDDAVLRALGLLK